MQPKLVGGWPQTCLVVKDKTFTTVQAFASASRVQGYRHALPCLA